MYWIYHQGIFPPLKPLVLNPGEFEILLGLQPTCDQSHDFESWKVWIALDCVLTVSIGFYFLSHLYYAGLLDEYLIKRISKQYKENMITNWKFFSNKKEQLEVRTNLLLQSFSISTSSQIIQFWATAVTLLFKSSLRPR